MTKNYTIKELYDMIHEGQDIYDNGRGKKWGYATVTRKQLIDGLVTVNYTRRNGSTGTTTFAKSSYFHEQTVDNIWMFKKGGWNCWFVVQGECSKCIYECKDKKKCTLFTEEVK